MFRRNLLVLWVIFVFFVVLAAILVLQNRFSTPIVTNITPSPPAVTEISPILPLETESISTYLPVVDLWNGEMDFLPAIFSPEKPVREELRPVPFFAQADPKWSGVPLYGCLSWYTLGSHGCALTSAAMVFAYYGADTNPPKLNQCMQNEACPFIWKDGAANCSDGKVQYIKRMPFNWEKLDNQLNNKKRPVVLCLVWSATPQYGHCMVVVSGSGTGRINYYVNDPGKPHGNVRLDFAASGGKFTEMIIYDNK